MTASIGAGEGLEQTVYNQRFDSARYLHTRFVENVGVLRKDYPLREFHQFFKTNANPGLRILDYGCGPTLLYSISAAAHASELVLAEYTTNNRQALQQWADKDPIAFDWSPYFDYVVQDLEGGTEQQARDREGQMRRIMKIVPCDVTQDIPIEKGYEGPYDIITTSFCLECSSETLEEYTAAMKRVTSLLKPGGKIAVYSAERAKVGQRGSYEVGNETFQDVAIDGDFVKASLERCGLMDVVVKHFKGNLSYSDLVGTAFINATKAV